MRLSNNESEILAFLCHAKRPLETPELLAGISCRDEAMRILQKMVKKGTAVKLKKKGPTGCGQYEITSKGAKKYQADRKARGIAG